MTRTVFCVKLGQEMPGLEYAPIKGDLGRRIYEQISAEAWKQWLKHSTMIINEYRLNPSEPEARGILREQMEKFFFGEPASPPPGYVPPSED